MTVIDFFLLAINSFTAGGIGFLAWKGGKWVGRLETMINGHATRLEAHDGRLTYLERTKPNA